MVSKEISVEIEVPEGITLKFENRIFSIKGPKGELSKKLFAPGVDIKADGKTIAISSKKGSKKTKAIINTFRAHLLNYFKGVTEGYEYKLSICSGHFPMNVSAQSNKIIIKNFIGEKHPRTKELSKDVNIKINGKEIVLTGADKELVGQAAADIEQLTRRPGYDRRIFQDGIFIVSKAGKEI